MVEEEALAPIRRALETALFALNGAQRRLAELTEERHMRWRCVRCHHIKTFTRPMPSHVAPPCPKCQNTEFVPAP